MTVTYKTVRGSEITSELLEILLESQRCFIQGSIGSLKLDEQLSYTFFISDSEPLGVLGWLQHADGIWVQTAFVQRAKRRQGIMQSLLKHLEAEHRGTAISLGVNPKNVSMLSLLGKIGYQQQSIVFKKRLVAQEPHEA
jgi:GNAT superfamily N-acetyltransferase